MREIAKAFDMSIEKVEAEIVELIISKQIKAKIDSHTKVSGFDLSLTTLIQLLYSKKEDQTFNSYKDAVELGRNFIQETETALLRV